MLDMPAPVVYQVCMGICPWLPAIWFMHAYTMVVCACVHATMYTLQIVGLPCTHNVSSMPRLTACRQRSWCPEVGSLRCDWHCMCWLACLLGKFYLHACKSIQFTVWTSQSVWGWKAPKYLRWSETACMQWSTQVRTQHTSPCPKYTLSIAVGM